jgi:hypothetical protein
MKATKKNKLQILNFVGLGNITGIGKFQDAAIATNPSIQFGTLISSLITTITVVGGLAFMLYFVLGGLKWITAGGDKTKVSEAQTSMTQGAIGLIVIVVSYFVVAIIGAVLGVDILNPFAALKLN